MQGSLASFSDEPSLSDFDWAFAGADTSFHLHGIMGYPARMPPQLPQQAFHYLKKTNRISAGDCVVDPFCGSGTAAPEARRAGVDFHGIDINPFACQLARAKGDPVAPDAFASAFNSIMADWQIYDRFIEDTAQMSPRRNQTDKDGEADPIGEPVSVKKHWFPKPQVYKIDSLARRLSEARSRYGHRVIRLLRLALAKTARKVSYQQPGEFKRQRIAPEERHTHDPDVASVFTEVAHEFYDRLSSFHDSAPSSPTTTVSLGDNRDPELLDANSADAILTSPPYGDSATTAAYGQFSNIPANAAMPLSYEQMRNVDKNGLGGDGTDSYYNLSPQLLRVHSTALDKTLCQLESKDGRTEDALSFISDYAESIIAMARICSEGGPTILVVGNRTMSRTPIPLHHITTELATIVGFTHIETVPRSIPTKTLPYANAPENISGDTGEMMADEYIIHLEAPKSPTADAFKRQTTKKSAASANPSSNEASPR